MTDPTHDLQLVLLDLHPGAPSVSETAPGQLVAETLARHLQTGGKALHDGDQPRTMRLTGGKKTEHTPMLPRPDPKAARPSDLVDREFTADAPNRLWVADLTHTATWAGVAYTCFITDAFSWRIGGWRVSFPTEQAFWDFHAQFEFKPEVDVRWPPFIEELDRPEKMHIIAERLERRGFSGAEVAQVMGGNFMRVYEEILG